MTPMPGPMPAPAPLPRDTGSAKGGGPDDAQIQERVEFWMLAYPRRWREVRGEELRALVIDLAGPAARRLRAHAAFALVPAGWAPLNRSPPPLRT